MAYKKTTRQARGNTAFRRVKHQEEEDPRPRQGPALTCDHPDDTTQPARLVPMGLGAGRLTGGAPGEREVAGLRRTRGCQKRGDGCGGVRVRRGGRSAGAVVGLGRQIRQQSVAYLPFNLEWLRTAAFPSCECELPARSGP